MNSRILTLFGEELPPEQIKAVGKSRSTKKESTATKKSKEKKEVANIDILAGWKADKQYYSIGEVATLFHVKTSNIRFWTKEFELKVRTTRKGDRLYTPDQIRELRAIYNLVKERGFTINGAKSKLKSNKRKTVEAVDLKQSLLHLRNKLISIRNQIS